MGRNTLPRRKHIRLDPSVYAETGCVCSITISTRERKSIFSDAALASACVDLLTSLAADSGVKVFAYCLMPDHVHLLISPSDRKSIIDFVREFKSLSARLAWQYGHDGRIWQQSFYDRFLRREEDEKLAATYILNNPVRKGMTEEWNDYPYSGSLGYSL